MEKKKPFFIRYANHSLRKDPQNLHKIFTPDVFELLLDNWRKEQLPHVIEMIISFSGCTSIDEATEKYNEYLQLWKENLAKDQERPFEEQKYGHKWIVYGGTNKS